MSATIIDGNAVAEEIKQTVAEDARQLRENQTPVRLVAIQVGESPASKVYTNMQARACQAVHIEYDLQILPAETSQDELIAHIEHLNGDPAVSAIILQMPLPSRINARIVQTRIHPDKDVEGMHPTNLGRLFYGRGDLAPCTALSSLELLNRTIADPKGLAGLEVVIVGHSEIFGKPMAMMLLQSFNYSPTVTVCHAATRDLAAHTRQADVVIPATGVRQIRWQGYRTLKAQNRHVCLPDLGPLITADMLKDDAIIIDVGINRIPVDFDHDGNPLRNENDKIMMQTVGDVDFQGALSKVRAITPVPSGVGAVTTAILLRNTIICANKRLEDHTA
jgi:methylenetetrahydrofolate dehydrogenase (NADP+) / methenyltetrahydrofolate cyclohydrolase